MVNFLPSQVLKSTSDVWPHSKKKICFLHKITKKIRAYTNYIRMKLK